MLSLKDWAYLQEAVEQNVFEAQRARWDRWVAMFGIGAEMSDDIREIAVQALEDAHYRLWAEKEGRWATVVETWAARSPERLMWINERMAFIEELVRRLGCDVLFK